MIKKIVLVLAILFTGVLAYAATRPDTLHIERSVTIKASPGKIFPLINNLRAWPQWSAYETKDPAMKRTYTGPEAGKGAVYEWEGNSEVGSGRMEIIEVQEPSRIAIKLDFLEPFEGHNVAEFTLKPENDSTTVRWVMEGPNRYLGKLISVFIDVDDMVGKDFDTGLANIKTIAEK